MLKVLFSFIFINLNLCISWYKYFIFYFKFFFGKFKGLKFVYIRYTMTSKTLKRPMSKIVLMYTITFFNFYQIRVNAGHR